MPCSTPRLPVPRSAARRPRQRARSTQGWRARRMACQVAVTAISASGGMACGGAGQALGEHGSRSGVGFAIAGSLDRPATPSTSETTCHARCFAARTGSVAGAADCCVPCKEWRRHGGDQHAIGQPKRPYLALRRLLPRPRRPHCRLSFQRSGQGRPAMPTRKPLGAPVEEAGAVRVE
jgi:hypothetical protein